VKIRKSRWNAGVFRFKCDHGPQTDDFYLCIGGNVAISDDGRKWSVDASLVQTTPKRRASPDYKAKHSNEFKAADNLYPAGYHDYEMEGVNFDYLSEFSTPDVTPVDRGRPGKVVNHHSNTRFQRRNQELAVILGLADEERLELIATVRDQGRALVALSSSGREMDDLKIKVAALEEKNVISAEKLLEAKSQVDAAMEETSIARNLLRDVIVNNTTEITEDATAGTEMMEHTEKSWSNMNKYSATKILQHLNSFCEGRGRWVQHAKAVLNMAPLRCLLIGFVIVLLRETLFTKKMGTGR
jgi:hypothetical protein